MFNYTKEVIINAFDTKKGLVDEKNTELRIPRAANYKKDLILDGAIYKTEPITGEAGKVVITPAFTTGDALRLTLFLSTPNVELAEFGTPCWQDFGKPIIVEVGKGDKAIERLAAAVKVAAGEYVKVANDTTTITLTGKEKWMDFQDVTLTEVQYMDADGEEKVLTTKTKNDPEIVITPAKAEFGTAEWINHTLRFPSAPNRRYSPLFADELPVRGAEYVQYVFKYIARHTVPGGLSGVDQCVDSITAHIFYVKSDLSTAFDKELGKLGITPIPITGDKDSTKTAPVASMNPYSAGAQAVDVAAAKAKADKAASDVAALEVRVKALEG